MTTAQHSGARGLFLMSVAEVMLLLGLDTAMAVRMKVALALGRCLTVLACGAHLTAET
jgi:hypothetical protein